ncbi:MAG: single-stranded DNA-binding protein [Candidatus Babeliales bacterium]
MAGYNRIVMIGNLTRDPEYKQLPSGQAVARLGLATNRQYRNKQSGAMVQEVCFIDIDVFGPQAESCRQYLQKGRSVLIEGRLKFDTWETAEGQTRSKHSIVADRVVFLSSQGEASEDAQEESRPAPAARKVAVAPEAAAPRARKVAPKINVDNYDQAPSAGELSFQDEPPFQDDLPF